MLPGLCLWRRFVVSVLAAVAVLVLASPVGGGHSDYDSSQLIAFTRADGIYVIRADGTGERPLRRGGVAAGVAGLAWSPSGRRVAFTSSGGGLWVMDADGKNLVRLVSPAQISAKAWGSLSWSPLGRRVAFSAPGAEGRPDIWLVNADGTNPHRLVKTPNHSELYVDWSPYGDRVAFADPIRWFFRLYVMATNGKHLRAINPGWFFQAAMPRWSPQGNRLTFMGWLGSLNMESLSTQMRTAEIWVTPVNGRYPRQLTHNSVVDSNPSWSFDGSKIVFLRGVDQEMVFVPPLKRSAAEIYVMNADGTGVKQLTHNQLGEGSPAWQPIPTSSGAAS
jgi:TolB protein